MARKSKFRITETETPTPKVYRVGAYVRLSVLDSHQSDGDSIGNQETLVCTYIESNPSLSLCCVYSDNGETGVNFERDNFERLLDDIKADKIDCVIVKDFSRFGRNYIEAGEYLDKIFPFMGVRFIAVNDGYDSLDPATSDSLSMHLKNLVNDIYARDISQKICPVLQEKQEQGKFIGSWVYGYLKSKEDKHRLVVDRETAAVVRMMFKWRLSGMNYQKIARELRECGIPTPGRYRFEKGMVKSSYATTIWNGGTVKNILSSEVYLGHTVQGKTRKALWNGQAQVLQPKDKWVIVENTHEALVDRKTFDAVQRMGEQARKKYDDNQGAFQEFVIMENTLQGLVYCGDCGKKLVRQKSLKKNKGDVTGSSIRYYFSCHTHAEDRSRCVSVRVSETVLLEVVSRVLQMHLITALDMETMIKSLHYKAVICSKKQEIRHCMKQAEEKIERNVRLREALYDDYLEQLMNESDYLYAKNRYAEQEAEQKSLLAELSVQDMAVSGTGGAEPPWLQTLLSFREGVELTRKLALELIDRIVVYNKTNIVVKLRFEDEYERLKGKMFPPTEVAVHEYE